MSWVLRLTDGRWLTYWLGGPCDTQDVAAAHVFDRRVDAETICKRDAADWGFLEARVERLPESVTARPSTGTGWQPIDLLDDVRKVSP